MNHNMTSNLSTSELEDLYGNRVRSRMLKIVDLIAFNRKSCDKR